MFRRQGDIGILEELGTDGKQLLVGHGNQDPICGGLLHTGHEEQCECLNGHGKEGGEG